MVILFINTYRKTKKKQQILKYEIWKYLAIFAWKT